MAPDATITLAEAAARYAAAGWPVFPLHHTPAAGGCSCPDGLTCRQPGKHPRRAGGHHHATTDPAQVAAWWRRWPTANIGIPTGPASGLVVVDLDGPAGTDTWTRLTRQHGAGVATASATTPHGEHHWYRHPDSGPAVPRRIGLLGPGVDLLGDRGYAIAPPSAIPCTRQTPHHGPCTGRYTWTTPRARLAPLPGWITARAAEHDPAPGVEAQALHWEGAVTVIDVGDLFADDVEAIVNPVNTAGVMGAGLAAAIKTRFPDHHRAYQHAVRVGQLRIGQVLATPSGRLRPAWIIALPTKRHWRDPSRLDDLDRGLGALHDAIRQRGIRSIAVPALGCGLGGLGWDDVRLHVRAALAGLEGVDVRLYAPGAHQRVERAGTPAPVRQAMRAARTDRIAHPPSNSDAYARVALAGEAARVTSAAAGQRNNTLNIAAYRLGRLVGAGLLTRVQVREVLYQAAVECGHVADDGEHVARRSIESGLSAGAANPRAPARPSWRDQQAARRQLD